MGDDEKGIDQKNEIEIELVRQRHLRCNIWCSM